MQVEVGKIYEGKVTGITKYGAFVEVGEKTTGMVHISEVANHFVSDINECLSVGQTVKVKVIKVENGKIALSIKRTLDKPEGEKRSGKGAHEHKQTLSRRVSPKPKAKPELSFADAGGELSGPSENTEFENMLSRFKAASEERMSDLKRVTENKRRSGSRRR